MESAPIILGLALIFAGLASIATVEPTATTLQSSGQIGATLLIAYVLEVSWMVRAGRHRSLEERESRLGAFLGIGASGALGVAFSLVLAERVHAGHWNLLDDLGLGWVGASLVLLGAMVVLQPWVIHEWMDEDESTP